MLPVSFMTTRAVMIKLKDIGTPITCIKSCHSCVQAAKMDSSEEINLQTILYRYVGSEVMLTSNLWIEVGIYNVAKVEVIVFVYIDDSGPRNGGVS